MNEIPSASENHHTSEDLLPSRLRRFIPLLAVIGSSFAIVGFLIGIREPAATSRTVPVATSQHESLPSAVTYSELPNAKLQPNANWKQSLTQLVSDKPGLFDLVQRTDSMKQTALADRAKNRAYDGAPPTIPHPVNTQSTASCLSCHGEGLQIGDRVASKISHPAYSHCTQCHVEQTSESVDNDFIGVHRSGPGERANPGAPPTIPHRTWMRENCLSCHGLVARPGIRSTHPWLTNCIQCHAPSAILDQRANKEDHP